jgi:hypothetical protein
VTFESGSRLERIEEHAFSGSGLKSILIPSSVVVLGKESFRECKSLESVTFESGSRLERIEEFAFHGTGLRSIEIPASVVVLGKFSFYSCKSLESVTFESGSRLERIEEYAFYESGLESIEIPGCVAFVGGSAFAGLPVNNMPFRLLLMVLAVLLFFGLPGFVDGCAFVGLSLIGSPRVKGDFDFANALWRILMVRRFICIFVGVIQL